MEKFFFGIIDLIDVLIWIEIKRIWFLVNDFVFCRIFDKREYDFGWELIKRLEN